MSFAAPPHSSPADQLTAHVGTDSASAQTMFSALAALSATPFTSTAEALNAYLNLIARLLNVRSAFVSQLTSDAMYVLDSYDNQGCAIPADGIVTLEETFCQYVRATGGAVVVPDAATDVRTTSLATRHRFTIGAYLGVPLLLSDGTLFGTLCALDPEPCVFEQSQVDLMRIAASLLGAQIERAGLSRRLEHTTHAAEQLSTTLRTLEHQTEVLRVVAHDIRTPVTTITGYSMLLKSGLFGQVDPEQIEALDRISAAARFINRLSNDLVDSAAAEQQQLALIIEAFDPQQIVEQVGAACQVEARHKGLTLQWRCCDLPPTIHGDSDRLQQVLLNLLSNALRYTERGSITLSATGTASNVEFRVQDSGPGIAPELQQHIWQRYTRASGQGPGLGLGLYVVRQLVTAMGGTVGLESQPGAGACFWVRLPLEGPQPQRVAWT